MYNFILSHKKAYYAALIALLTLMLVPLMFNNNVWGDEAYTILIIRESIPSICAALAADVQTIPYYLIVKFFVILFGESFFVIRIVSIIPSILMMILGATLVDSYFGKGGISVATFFICAQVGASSFLQYTVELRMYSWTLFFVTASGLLAYSIYTFGITKKRSALFIAASICAAALHYFAIPAIAFIYGFLFVLLLIKTWSNLKYCLAISAITFILYLPNLYVFIPQFGRVSDGFWIAPLTVTDMILALGGPISTPWVGVGALADVTAFALCLILGALLLKNLFSKNEPATKRETICAILFISIYVLWLISILIISVVMQPLYLDRYAFPTYGVFWLGIVIGVKSIPSKYLRTGLFVLLFSSIACSGLYYYQKELGEASYNGANEMIEYISEAEASGEEIYALTSDISHLTWTILSCHFPAQNVVTMTSMDFSQLQEGEVIYIFASTEDVDSIQDEIEEYNISSEYIYAGGTDVNTPFFLYKLYLT